MKTKDIKKGISLIVLIITIIVVIILASVVILTLSKNNPIENAKEARFKEDVRTFQDELALTVSKQYTTAGGHRDDKITTSDFDEIQGYIPSFSEKYKDKFVIENDELVYTNKVTENEKIYLSNLNIKKEFNYIQEGLILHLDGINNTRNGHSTTTTTWEDLSGNNNDFTKLDSASNAEWSSNSYVGNRTNKTLVLNKALLAGANECTVEVCYDIPKLFTYYWVFQNRDQEHPANGFEFCVNSEERDIYVFKNSTEYNSLSKFTQIKNLKKMNIAFTADNSNITFSENCQFYTEATLEGTIDSITQRNCYTIGGAYPWMLNHPNGKNLWFEGNIYSIRVYNRKLSEDELRNNYEVDKVRFEME